ncbi:ferredoxin [Candidatus Woesearchaeota archaeon]|nr:ferredoxin [Candidatus Woesearchaeota archaeon]
MAKLQHDKEKCIGCGACAAVAPDLFEMTAEGKAAAKKEEISDAELGKAKEASAGCPVGAIKIDENG